MLLSDNGVLMFWFGVAKKKKKTLSKSKEIIYFLNQNHCFVCRKTQRKM